MPSIPSTTSDAALFSAIAEQRVLAGAPATLTVTLFDQDGAAADAAGAVTLEVARDDGTILVPAGTAATHGAADSGIYTYGLTAAQTSVLDLLTVEWTDQTSGAVTATHVDVAGGYYLTVAEIRGLKNLDNTTKYSNADLIEARRWFEDTFELYTGRAFVPRYKRAIVWGDASDQVQLPDEYVRHLRGVTVGTTVLDDQRVSSLEVLGNGIIRRPRPDPLVGQYPTILPNGWPIALFSLDQKVTVTYEYGLSSTPRDIREAAKVAIRDRLMTDYTGLRELSVQTEIGIVRTSTPGPDRPFGIPSVDKVANGWRRADKGDGTMTLGSVQIG